VDEIAGDAGPTLLDFDPTSHTYRVNGMVVPSVTQLLDGAGLTPDYKFISREVLAHARARGLHVDACCDLLDEGDLDWSSVHPEAVPYVESWARFCADYGYEPAAGQVPLYHPQYGYAGTADSIGTLNGSWVVVERKATTKMAATRATDGGLRTAGALGGAPGWRAAVPRRLAGARPARRAAQA
jgi:hypothetical protein